jgi:hypothetical protein
MRSNTNTNYIFAYNFFAARSTLFENATATPEPRNKNKQTKVPYLAAIWQIYAAFNSFCIPGAVSSET